MNIVSYAINGRGVGHLVRQLAILRQVRRLCSFLGVPLNAWVLTSSEADTLARREGFAALKIPSKTSLRDAGIDPVHGLAMARAWVLSTVATLQPDIFIVDTFPGGSFGELGPVLELCRQRVLVARPVKDNISQDPAYKSMLPYYQRVLIPEVGPTPDHVGTIRIRDRVELLSREEARKQLGLVGRAVYVSLGGGGDLAAPSVLGRLIPLLRAKGWEVVVGAGPLYQGPEQRGPGVVWLDRYTPSELFPAMDAAISAGGYNSFHELMDAGVPTVFLPQPRLADDQRARALGAQAQGAGRVAQSVEEAVELLENPGSPAAAMALAGENGAMAAAVRVLGLGLPWEDLRVAQQAMSSERIGQVLRAGFRPEQVVELLRLVSGELPSEKNRRMAEKSLQVGTMKSLERLLVASEGVPNEIRLALLTQLPRRFPAARGEELMAGMERFFELLRGYQDWMGALSLVRALPVQRQYAINEFLEDFTRFSGQFDDLFDALRALSAAEGAGQRTLAEVLKDIR